jgi:magnesium-transporting ATPase (P-type)
LLSNTETGLTPIDFHERERHFGSNYRAPPKRTPFCRLFLAALDDFMMKLLLVCAVVSISIEVGFAKPADRSHGKEL